MFQKIVAKIHRNLGIPGVWILGPNFHPLLTPYYVYLTDEETKSIIITIADDTDKGNPSQWGNAGGVTWWPYLQPMQVAATGGQIPTYPWDFATVDYSLSSVVSFIR